MANLGKARGRCPVLRRVLALGRRAGLGQAFDQRRNLWCCAVFPAIADKSIVRQGEEFAVVDRDELGGRIPVYDFEPVRVIVSDDGTVTKVTEGGQCFNRFRIHDREHYAEAMTAITSDILQRIDSAFVTDVDGDSENLHADPQ